MKGDKELVGTLSGFDDYVSTPSHLVPPSLLLALTIACLCALDMVLDDVTELYAGILLLGAHLCSLQLSS